MSANDHQEGGSHYRSAYQHWDWVLDNRLGYLEGNATKYLARYQHKGCARSDLRKALHYIDKLLERDRDGYVNLCLLYNADKSTVRFAEANKLDFNVEHVLRKVAFWQNKVDLIVARRGVLNLLTELGGEDGAANTTPVGSTE